VTDVLIVGAGSAGSVLAAQLSSDPHQQVTVLEAGPGPEEPMVRALTADALTLPIGPDSPVIRRYRTLLTADPPRTADIVRGFCLGGSGAVNGCYFWRAAPRDFEEVPGWSWAQIEQHYRAVEARIPARTVDFSATTRRFVAAAEAAGHRSGIAPVPLNIDHGRRLGPGAVFLEPALQRPNLTLLTGTRVSRIRFSAGRAVGVDAIGRDGPLVLDADRVVLAAGAVVTAQLLMLSGIGPADDLTALGIPVRVDLPVGRNSWDHPEWVVPTAWPAAGNAPVLEAVLNHADLEIRPYTTGFGAPELGIGVALMRPRARGRVTLASADPAAPPRIEHRYDSERADIAVLREGCRLVTEMIGATGRSGDSGRFGEPVWSTSQHLAGTAPMGTGDQAVIDAALRVRGVTHLWVADGSVLPAPLGRGPHATIAMIGHRAAELIRAAG
jgi:predicted dehydrogenase (TIGR03970 family)